MKNIQDKEILNEFNNSNFQNAYKLAKSIDINIINQISLKILIISSFRLKKFSECIKFSHKYLEVNKLKNNFDILNILGISYSTLKEYENGNKFFKEILLYEPKNISVNYNLGFNLFKQKKYFEAKKVLIKVVTIKKWYQNSELLLGIINSELKNFNEAIKIFTNLIENNKYTSEANYNLGIVYQTINKYELSIIYFSKAIDINNKEERYYNSIGISYQKLFKFNEAEEAYNKAIKLNNHYTNPHINLGLINQKKGLFKNALKIYDAALKDNPNNSQILYNKSICLLESGNFKDGFKLYKWRQEGKFLKSSDFDLNGIKDKTIYITCDQGLGDIILLTRYVILLSEYCAKIIFQIPKGMEEIMSFMNENIVITSDLSNQSYDYICSLGDLFQVFKVNSDNIPMTKAPYFKIDKKWSLKWKSKLNTNKYNVGIAWQGKKGGIVDEGRSFELKNFEKISKLKGIQLVSLQKNDGKEQITKFNEINNIINFDNELDLEHKFIDTAGLMQNLDLVISSDTSIVHLAGSLGIKTWLLVQKYPFWYWQLDNDKSIWYNSVKIFKQKENSNWKKLFDQIEQELMKEL